MKCLITGGHGNLGKELIKCSEKYGIEYIAPTSKELNITSAYCVSGYNTCKYEPVDCIVHCAAYTNVPMAEQEKDKVIDTNIIGTKNVFNELCLKNKVPLVYLSTDYVYKGSGKAGGYKETDPTRPVNFYSFTKLAGETYTRPDDLIIRTSFKPRVWKYSRAFYDLYTSADFIDIIAEKINFLIANQAKGIFNVGTERKSIFELAKRCNKDVLPMFRHEVESVDLPFDVSMNLEKYNLFYEQIKNKSV